jgi:CheY-like chemotaxis protein
VLGERAVNEGNILLVEDDEAVRQVYSRLLKRDGFAVFLARNGLEATWC